MKPFRVVLLAIAWCVLTRELSVPNVLVGVALAVVLVRLSSAGTPDSEPAQPSAGGRGLAAFGRRAWRRPLHALDLGVYFLRELVVSNVRIALLVSRPKLRLEPQILCVPVDTRSEEELAVLSDLVTLTPGTLTLDVLDDGRTLLVHVLSPGDPEDLRSSIRDGLARRVRRLFQ